MTDQLSLCAQDVRQSDHDQFLCGLFAPEEFRDTFYALQVFYIETARIRDLVNEPHLGLIRLQWWRDFLDGKSDGAEQGTHKEIYDLFSKATFDQTLIARYFNARSFDMEDQRHDDLAALKRYCQATGGSISRLKANSKNEEENQAAELIGQALTLCEIVRTLPYQARSQRCKLPQALITQVGLDMKSFFDFQTTESLKQAVQILADEMRADIKEARRLFKGSNGALLSSVSIEDYLKRLDKVAYDPFNPNIGGGRLKRQLVMMFRSMRGTF